MAEAEAATLCRWDAGPILFHQALESHKEAGFRMASPWPQLLRDLGVVVQGGEAL